MVMRGLFGVVVKVFDFGFGEEVVECMVGVGEVEIEELVEKFGEEVSESFFK